MQEHIVLDTFVCMMPGASRSLALRSEGKLYVVKSQERLREGSSLAGEFVASELLRRIEVPVPRSRIATFSQNLAEYLGFGGNGIFHFASEVARDNATYAVLPIASLDLVRNSDHCVAAALVRALFGQSREQDMIFVGVPDSPFYEARFIDFEQLFARHISLSSPKSYKPVSAIAASAPKWVDRLLTALPACLDFLQSEMPHGWGFESVKLNRGEVCERLSCLIEKGKMKTLSDACMSERYRRLSPRVALEGLPLFRFCERQKSTLELLL